MEQTFPDLIVHQNMQGEEFPPWMMHVQVTAEEKWGDPAPAGTYWLNTEVCVHFYKSGIIR